MTDDELPPRDGVIAKIRSWIMASAPVLWVTGSRNGARKKKRRHDDSFVDPEYDRGASMLLNRLEDDKRRAAEDRVRNRRA